MTIALGILASDGIVLGADTLESDGYFKDDAYKITSAMTHTAITSQLESALAITGAGPGVHLDSITEEITRMFLRCRCRTVAEFEEKLKPIIEGFYLKHVASLPPHMDRDFRLIVAVQITGILAMWTSEATVIRSVLGMEAVGTGSPFAKMALGTRILNPNWEKAVLLAALGVKRAKEYDHYSGSGTTIVCLKDNVAYGIPWYRISQADKIFDRYSGIEHSAFQYVLGSDLPDADGHMEKMRDWLKNLRKDISTLGPQMFRD